MMSTQHLEETAVTQKASPQLEDKSFIYGRT